MRGQADGAALRRRAGSVPGMAEFVQQHAELGQTKQQNEGKTARDEQGGGGENAMLYYCIL